MNNIYHGGYNMKVKIFDFEHEVDLEKGINSFIEGKNIVDIKYSTSHFSVLDEQIFSFSAIVIYKENE